MKTLLGALAAVMALALALAVQAEVASPAGLWKIIDDKTGKERALIRITENNGAFEGRLEKIITQPGDDPQHLCRKCEGVRKDQPIEGMLILSGLKKDGDQYTGGEILDAKEGRTYRCKAKLVEGGAKLEVRGFIGISLFGRSQTWLREQ
ncbi:MAG: DUF2147 domain-containing protein [Betaproteobacteria bacterium]